MSKKEQRRAEVMALLLEGAILQREAAERLGIDSRHVRRLLTAYKAKGAEGLVSKKRNRPSNNRIADLTTTQIIERVLEEYPDFGPTFARQKLVEEDGFTISVSSLRRIMIESGIWLARTKKARKIHPRREPRPRFGELVQIDGSPHDWFEGRAPKCCLIVFIDDATSALLGLRFVEAECTRGYFEVVKSYLQESGRPEAFYSDKHSIFRINHGENIETSRTEFGRAMKELDIRIICAHSPQAKGRVERANSTLQDRLPKEMRLRNISTIEDANAFLPEFRKDYNSRFAKPPKNPVDAHRALNRKCDLERILSIHDTRKVSKTLSFQFENTYYQILEEGHRARQLIRKRVTIVKTLADTIRVFSGDRELTFTTAELRRGRPMSLDSKELNPEFERWLNQKERPCPANNHPLKRWKIK